MKKSSILLFVLLAFSLFGQEKKYQSLLWEVSGNGLAKKSYIYGTMHLSDKVTYHLSDAFFKHLMEADMVANESNPETWKELDEMINIQENYGKFYSSFYRFPVNKNNLKEIFNFNSFALNNLLYRTNDYRKEYQEETYLDMFIHQTAKKYNKQTPSLEDVKVAYALVAKTQVEYEAPDEEKIQKLNKLLKNKSMEDAMTDYYREKNLDDLDALYSLILPRNYLEALLIERNRIFVKSMDSLMKKGSLFAAMGAAHIPGDEGVVNMLRLKGYTVKPITSNYTDVGKNVKKKIDNLFIKPTLKIHTSDDGMIKLPMKDLVLNQNDGFNSPDLTNGGYINVKRTNLFDFLQKDKNKFNHKQLDSLFFENIPGNIEDKKWVEVSKNLKYYDIKNTTKSNNTQRHRFYITPLEIITISMTGNGNYSKNFNEEVFNGIQIKDVFDKWDVFQNEKNSFEVEIPNFFIANGNQKNPVNPINTEVYAFDSTNNSYFFVIENNPKNYEVDETAFDLERIQEEFYNQLEAGKSTIVKKEQNSFQSKNTFNNKNIELKTVTDGVTYYLMGCVNCNDTQTNKFFNSFKINRLVLDQKFKTLTQKEAFYSVEVPEKQNEIQFLVNSTKKFEKKKTKNTNLFESQLFNHSYVSQNGSKVDVISFRYHPYQYEKAPDSIYVDYKNTFLKEVSDEKTEEVEEEAATAVETGNENNQLDSYYGDNYYSARKAGPLESTWDKSIGNDIQLKKNYIITNEKKYQNGKQNIYEFLLTKPFSSKVIKNKVILNDGISYLIKTAVTKDYKNDNPFLEKIFESVKPKDTTFGASVYTKKIDLFISHLESPHDSIKNSAMKSISYLKIEKEDGAKIDKLLKMIDLSNKEFSENILEKIASIDLPSVYNYLDKTYKDKKTTNSIQIAILKGLASQKSKNAYLKIKEYLNHDTPISEDGIDDLFTEFSNNLEYSQALVPDIFEFLPIQEYQNPIVNFTKILIEKNKIDNNQLASFKSQILANAKLEYKRILNWKNEKDSSQSYDYYNRSVYVISKLNTFLHILHPFKKDQDVNQWWNNVIELDINEVLIEMLSIDLNKKTLDKKFVEELLENPYTQFASYCLIKDKDKKYALPKIAEKEIAINGVLLLDIIDISKKSLDFITEKIIDYNNQKIKFYFYKSKNIKQENEDAADPEVTLMSIGFVLDKNNNIIPEAFYSGLQTKIVSDEKLELYYKQVIEKSLHEYRENATFGKIEKENFDQMMMGDY